MRPRTSQDDANLQRWEDLLHSLFPSGIPADHTWDKLETISKILNKIGTMRHGTYCFFPTSGGLDVMGAEVATESGCLGVNLHGQYVVLKTRYLQFYSFPGQALEWAYFRLEALPLPVIAGQEAHVHEDGMFQRLSEVDGEYLSPDVVESWSMEDADSNAIKPPKSARRVNRYLKGSFIVVAKGSAYNRVPATYDGRHDKMGGDREFHAYMQRAASEGEHVLLQRNWLKR